MKKIFPRLKVSDLSIWKPRVLKQDQLDLSLPSYIGLNHRSFFTVIGTVVLFATLEKLSSRVLTFSGSRGYAILI